MSFTVFSAAFITELRDFRADTLAPGRAAIDLPGAAENTELAGFAAAADEPGWTLIHTVSAIAAPAGPSAACRIRDHAHGKIGSGAEKHAAFPRSL